MDFSFVKTETKDRLCNIILARPEKRNAFNDVFVRELTTAFAEADANPEVKVIILKAEGTTFSAGADLEYLRRLQGFSYEENLSDSNNLKELFLKIQSLKKIVIAQIEGHAIAGGCGLATVCDFTIAVPEAQFGYTEVKIGFIPAIVMVFLIRKIQGSKARELLFTGKLITADEAAEIGLINKVVSKEAIDDYVTNFARQLAEDASSQSLAMTKEMMATIPGLQLNDALAYAAKMNASARETADCKRGIQAFLNKEKITW